MTIRAFALCHVLRCPPPLSDCPPCFSIHRCICLLPLLSPVRPSPHPRLMLSCHHLLLRHQHLPSTPIASLPPPAATTISFALPIRPLRLHLLHRLLSPCYRLLCIASSTPQSHFASRNPTRMLRPASMLRWPRLTLRSGTMRLCSILEASVPGSMRSSFVRTPMVRSPRGSSSRASLRSSMEARFLVFAEVTARRNAMGKYSCSSLW